jgi:inosine-uridine nucleoside N-ribohydrolase
MCKTITVSLVLLVILFLQAPRAFAQTKQPVPIIFDTDMGPDYDDVGAIALLHALADSGECSILATMASNRHPYVAPVLDVLNTYFNRPSLPIGVVQGKALAIPAIQKWDSMLTMDYPHQLKANTAATDALALYRRLLAEAPDKSITIVTVGFFTNMANLLRSGPDKYSAKNGLSLIKQKVKLLVSMAGRFDEGIKDFKEFNVMKDAPASVTTFSEWPTPIIFSGFEIGAGLFTGLPILHNAAISHSPVKDVFARSIPMDPNDKNGRMSWDETAVLVAVRGYQPYFNLVKGKIIPQADGGNGWDAKGKRDGYLVKKMPAAELEKILNDLIMHQPVKK